MTKHRMREIRQAARKCGDGWMPAMEEMVLECLADIERLQAFTRRGESPTLEPASLPNSAKPNGKTGDPNVKLFIDGFYDAYRQFHKTPYVVTPGKDTSAAARLVKLFAVDELLDTAWEAWKHPDKFACRQALTIAGFASKINEVKVDLKLCANGGRAPRTEPPGVTL